MNSFSLNKCRINEDDNEISEILVGECEVGQTSSNKTLRWVHKEKRSKLLIEFAGVLDQLSFTALILIL